MKSGNSSDIIEKDVVVIGNGPSGLAISYMLSGNIPYLISNAHPDELLATRLGMVRNRSLARQELGHLAVGLEGRSTNPISLLLDALAHPYADVGLELDSLVEWKKDGVEIDHVVLGNGPPGGSWHKMDPYILTLSLGSWMALPGLPYTARDGSEKRASAGNVARYYVQYMNEMGLGKYFRNGVRVVKIEELKECAPGQEELRQRGRAEAEQKLGPHPNNKWVERVDVGAPERVKICTYPETEESAQSEQQRKQKVCSLSNAFNFIRLRSMRKCKRRRDALLRNDLSPDRKIREVSQNTADDGDDTVKLINPFSSAERGSGVAVNGSVLPTELCKDLCRGSCLCKGYNRSISFACDCGSGFRSPRDTFRTSKSFNDDEQGSFFKNTLNAKSPYSLDVANSLVTKVPKAPSDCDNTARNSESIIRLNDNCDPSTSNLIDKSRKSRTKKWLVETYEEMTGKYVTYVCKDLVLANGASDLPNRLGISANKEDPEWLVHDVRSLELELDRYVSEGTNNNPDPVLVIGAGLSAADAIIATRCRNVPVLHVFRNKNSDLSKQLPENMYPEYHKVHQMMQDGGSSYPLYRALPECSLTEFNEKERTVTLTTKTGDELKHHVSFAAVLIGARPDMDFLPSNFNLGVDKKAPIDSKTNNVATNKLTHAISGFEGLYAMGPLAGDNFVRFIPGGALAIVSDLYRKNGY